MVMRIFGVGPSLGSQLMAEIGDVRRFHSKTASVAFAGIDASPYQSPNAPVNEAAHQFMEKKCSEGKHDKGYMTIPFTTQSWFDPAPGPDPVGSFRFPREMRDKELAQHISCSFRRAAEALEKIPQDHPDS